LNYGRRKNSKKKPPDKIVTIVFETMSRKEYNRSKVEMKRSRINKRREIVENRRKKKKILFDQLNVRVRNNQVGRCV
jgi:hypothetical protein